MSQNEKYITKSFGTDFLEDLLVKDALLSNGESLLRVYITENKFFSDGDNTTNLAGGKLIFYFKLEVTLIFYVGFGLRSGLHQLFKG